MFDAKDGDQVSIAHTFNGQGSPDEVRITLRYALTFGQTSPDRLRHYCEENPKVGLDCVGFAMNYFLYIGRLHERFSYITGYAERGTPRAGMAEVRARDIPIWEGGDIGHVAVVDAKEAGSRGLSVSEYAVREVRDGLFSVHVTGGGDSTVRIYGMP